MFGFCFGFILAKSTRPPAYITCIPLALRCSLTDSFNFGGLPALGFWQAFMLNSSGSCLRCTVSTSIFIFSRAACIWVAAMAAIALTLPPCFRALTSKAPPLFSLNLLRYSTILSLDFPRDTLFTTSVV